MHQIQLRYKLYLWDCSFPSCNHALASFHLGFHDGSDFPANIFGIEIVEQVLELSKIIVSVLWWSYS